MRERFQTIDRAAGRWGGDSKTGNVMNQIRFRIENTDPAERSLSITKEIQQIQRTNQSWRSVSRRSELNRSQIFAQTWRERSILFSFMNIWIVNYLSNLSSRNARLTFHDWSVIIEFIGAQPGRHRYQHVNLHRRFTSGDMTSLTGSLIYTLGVRYAFSTKIHEVKNK